MLFPKSCLLILFPLSFLLSPFPCAPSTAQDGSVSFDEFREFLEFQRYHHEAGNHDTIPSSPTPPFSSPSSSSSSSRVSVEGKEGKEGKEGNRAGGKGGEGRGQGGVGEGDYVRHLNTIVDGITGESLLNRGILSELLAGLMEVDEFKQIDPLTGERERERQDRELLNRKWYRKWIFDARHYSIKCTSLRSRSSYIANTRIHTHPRLHTH